MCPDVPSTILYPLIQDGASLLMRFCPFFLHVGEFLHQEQFLLLGLQVRTEQQGGDAHDPAVLQPVLRHSRSVQQIVLLHQVCQMVRIHRHAKKVGKIALKDLRHPE